jgi:hypothetical protein
MISMTQRFYFRAYYSGKAYRLLGNMIVKLIIKPKRNARKDQGPPGRRRLVMIL